MSSCRASPSSKARFAPRISTSRSSNRSCRRGNGGSHRAPTRTRRLSGSRKMRSPRSSRTARFVTRWASSSTSTTSSESAPSCRSSCSRKTSPSADPPVITRSQMPVSKPGASAWMAETRSRANTALSLSAGTRSTWHTVRWGLPATHCWSSTVLPEPADATTSPTPPGRTRSKRRSSGGRGIAKSGGPWRRSRSGPGDDTTPTVPAWQFPAFRDNHGVRAD